MNLASGGSAPHQTRGAAWARRGTTLARPFLARAPLLTVALVVLEGCASSHGFAAADSFPKEPRRPDGVAVDPAPASVQGKARGSTQTVGDVALVPAPSPEDARTAVKRFFDATLVESLDEVNGLLAHPSLWINPAGGRGPQQSTQFWQQRFSSLDYRLLLGRQIVRENEIEVYRYEDLQNPPPGRPGRPPEMTEGDILAKARMLVPRLGPDRYYGDEIVFLLKIESGQFRIRWVSEEFQLP